MAAFELATDCHTIAARLVGGLDVFEHVRDARVLWLFSGYQLKLRGARAAAIIGPGIVQGPMKDFVAWSLEHFSAKLWDGEASEFLVLVDRTYWHEVDDVRRERLVFHELKHLQPVTNQYGGPVYHPDGRLKLKTVPHDTEVFDDEVRRYGVAVCGLETHAKALDDSRRPKQDAGA